MDEKEQLKNLANQFSKVRAAFEMQVEVCCLEVTEIAKQISPAIGEISVTEAKDAIIREFIKRINEGIVIG